MKHFRQLTQQRPARADQVQDTICAIANVLAAILGAFGGASPIVVLIDDKCAFPAPEGSGDNA